MTFRNDNPPPRERPLRLHHTIMEGLRMGLTLEKLAEVMEIPVNQAQAILMLQSEN